jgi:hypothetical protein
MAIIKDADNKVGEGFVVESGARALVKMYGLVGLAMVENLPTPKAQSSHDQSSMQFVSMGQDGVVVSRPLFETQSSDTD